MRLQPLFALSILTFASATASAQLNRSFVSVTGSDANPCTAAAPCRSFDAAIAQTNSGGEILAVDSGGYGPFTIDRTLRVLAAPGVHAAVTASSGDAIVVDVGPLGAAGISRLALSGQGAVRGIHVASVHQLHIVSTSVDGFGQGIVLGNQGVFLLSDVSVRNPFSVGLNSEPALGTARVLVHRCSLSGGGVGAGIQALAGTRMDVVDTVLWDNSWGVFAGSSSSTRPTDVTIESSVMSNNDTGIEASGAFAVIRLSNSTVSHNVQGLAASSSGQLLSRQNNTVVGNSGANGTPTGTFGAI